MEVLYGIRYVSGWMLGWQVFAFARYKLEGAVIGDNQAHINLGSPLVDISRYTLRRSTAALTVVQSK